MSKRIFRSIWLLTLAVAVASLALIMFSLYEHFTKEQTEQLRNETTLVTRGVELNGQSYFDDLDTADFRITWITSDGAIIYDNEADANTMENHLEREEIKEALKSGYGESTRYSDTLAEKQFYNARRLTDGTVLRLSITQATVWTLFLKFAFPLLGLVLLSLILSIFIASRLSRRIVEPLNALDLDDPLSKSKDRAYVEIRPLLQRLEDQHVQIEKDKEELEKTSLIRQEFTANASHELKTPLHVISGYAELLESGMVKDDDITTFAGKIRTESQRMTKLVEDIIDLSLLDGGAVGVERERCDLYRIAQNAAGSLETEAQDGGVTVELHGEPAFVLGIPNVLYSIVYNLCSNAVKYTDRGGRVDVDVRAFPQTVQLCVRDTGIGIPREDLGRIFERFYRVDKSHSKEVGGTGLGLSIVKHAARIHDAKVTVESELGAGSAFTVTFPAAYE